MLNENSFDALIASRRRDAQEARIGENLSEETAFLLPFMLALSRLAAGRHAAEFEA